MRIRFQNIGLVKEAGLDLRDLTVVMGPNNSGKSTIATVLYAAVKAVPRGARARNSARGSLASPFRRIRGSKVDRDALWEAISKARETQAEVAIPHPVILGIARQALNAFTTAFLEELQAGLGADLSTLARRSRTGRKQPLKITIASESPYWLVEMRLRGSKVSSSITISDDALAPLEKSLDSNLPYFIGADPDGRRDESELAWIIQMLAQQMMEPLFREFPYGVHFLPAARSGLLQSHRVVAAAMMQRTRSIGIGEVSMPALSGLVADFLTEIILPNESRARSRRKSALLRSAERIEQEVLHGRVRREDTAAYPEIEYSDETGTYPVHRASSMISELAPIVLLLKGSVNRGDLLILEEPESHLHPESQEALAGILFDLAADVRLCVTTHSDFIISKINNKYRDERIHGKRSTTITALQISRGEDATVAEELTIDPVDGISEGNFTYVAERIYEDQIKQQIELVDE